MATVISFNDRNKNIKMITTILKAKKASDKVLLITEVVRENIVEVDVLRYDNADDLTRDLDVLRKEMDSFYTKAHGMTEKQPTGFSTYVQGEVLMEGEMEDGEEEY